MSELEKVSASVMPIKEFQLSTRFYSLKLLENAFCLIDSIYYENNCYKAGNNTNNNNNFN